MFGAFGKVFKSLQRSCFSKVAALAFGSLLLLTGCLSGDDGQDEGLNDVQRGYVFAGENCSTCHAIEEGQASSPNPAAPTFDELANRPDMSRIALTALLRTPHARMPDLIVESEQVDDLAAYIATLRIEE
jgi:mono/diheme cytochrome c family protein